MNALASADRPTRTRSASVALGDADNIPISVMRAARCYICRGTSKKCTSNLVTETERDSFTVSFEFKTQSMYRISIYN